MDEKTLDKYHGVGGSYTRDPTTGVRTRVAGPALPDEPVATPQARPAGAAALPPGPALEPPVSKPPKAKE
jgi:hypothetical protein